MHPDRVKVISPQKTDEIRAIRKGQKLNSGESTRIVTLLFPNLLACCIIKAVTTAVVYLGVALPVLCAVGLV
jgi:hypothetical protein